MAAANFDKHQLGTEQQLPHDVGEKAGVHLWVGQLTGKRLAVGDELMTAGCLVAVQSQNGHAEVRTGSLGVLVKLVSELVSLV